MCVAPEVLYKDDVTFGTDYWNLGLMIYVMYAGRHLSELKSTVNTRLINEYFGIINHMLWNYPFKDPDSELHDLVFNLTRYDPIDRLGTLDFQELKDHPFFRHVDLDTLHQAVSPGIVATDEDLTHTCQAEDVPPMALPPPPPAQAAATPHYPPTVYTDDVSDSPPQGSPQAPQSCLSPSRDASPSPKQSPTSPSTGIRTRPRSLAFSQGTPPRQRSLEGASETGDELLGAVGGAGVTYPESPSSKMSSPGYLETSGSLPIGAQSPGDQRLYKTLSSRNDPSPSALEPRAQPRRSPLSTLGPARHNPPSMRPISLPARGSSTGVMDPILEELNDIFLKTDLDERVVDTESAINSRWSTSYSDDDEEEVLEINI